MTQLNPPFGEFKFGLEKSYTLFWGDVNSETINRPSHVSMLPVIENTFGNDDHIIIGLCDGFNEFFAKKRDPEGPVFCLCVENTSTSLTQVADSLSALYRICSEIKLFWQEYPGKRFLPKNPETVARMKKIMADFLEYSPNSYSRFWQEHAMGELMIGLEL